MFASVSGHVLFAKEPRPEQTESRSRVLVLTRKGGRPPKQGSMIVTVLVTGWSWSGFGVLLMHEAAKTE